MASKKRTAAANDFIASVGALFDEAKRKGFTSVENIKCLNGRIIEYILPNTTTRPSHRTIRLPDGRLPATRVARPPNKLRVDGENLKRLEATDSYTEFVGYLRRAFTTQKDANKRSGDWKGDWNRRKRARRSRQQRAVLSSPSPSVDHAEENDVATSESKTNRGEESTTQEFDSGSLLGELSKGEGAQSALMTPESEDIPSNTPNIFSADAERATSQGPIKEENEENLDDLYASRQLISIKLKVGEDWTGQEERVLRSEESPTPETPLQRMQAVLPQLKMDIAQIPLGNWEEYEAKLTKFYSSSKIATLGFPDLLSKIRRIVFLPEELEVAVDGHWERLPAAVNICVILAEATSLEPEDVKQSLTNKWVGDMTHFIPWLKKATRYKA
ncbi:unnamed protein product [Clonostachys solani]|uniref:Uncharacterized protein n=1 Tax=Clonostachys solani TaxID=160281 RepID=A0A9P0EKJ9_9HYPO|nr:unnamed protein product [Clonostachys solani]